MPVKRVVERPAPAGDPLAIVALAVRFPGASTPGALWDMLRDGESAVRPVDRWDTAGLSSDRGALFELPAIQTFDPGAFGLRVEEARAELGRIGEVNLTAFEEYNELRTRHDDLESQRTDLDESVASIRSAIAKMNKTCRERFRETFDRVNEAFRTAYPELVGGGEAKLMLTDEEDLLETGVEIMVRPPGKRLQTLSLLSGGEKAMTAIALLLALFTVKPSPFCVLDEVDAPLDEANGARFNDMLKRMASMTQFLVVTHNRKTMECADTLYGITMPAPGCSTLVSVKIDG